MNNFSMITLPNGVIQIKKGDVVLVEYSNSKLQVVENIFDFAAQLPKAVVAKPKFDPFAIEEISVMDLNKVNAPALDDDQFATEEEILVTAPVVASQPLTAKPIESAPVLDDEDDDLEVGASTDSPAQVVQNQTQSVTDELDDLVTVNPYEEVKQEFGIPDAEDAAGDMALAEGGIDSSVSTKPVDVVEAPQQTIVVTGSLLDRAPATAENTAKMNLKTASLMFNIEEALSKGAVKVVAAINSTWSFAAIAAVNALMSKHTENIGRLELEVLVPEGVEFELMARTKAPKPLGMKPLSRKFGIKSKLDNNGYRVDEHETTKALQELRQSISSINASCQGDIEQTITNMMALSDNVKLVAVAVGKNATWAASVKSHLESVEGTKVSMDLTATKTANRVLEYQEHSIE